MHEHTSGITRGMGPAIRARRKALGLTTTELAVRVGCSAQAVLLWECGHRMPTIERLQVVANVLGVTLSELVADAEGAVPA